MNSKNEMPDATIDGPNKNFFTGSVPRNYDKYMGPILFNPYAIDLTGRISRHGRLNVLELAAGTGILTRYLLQALPAATITATDISEEMMDIAKETIHSPNLTWRNVDMETIPFADNSFDLVICQFGLMFANDKQQALNEMFRVLKPTGQLLLNTWGEIAENPLWQISFGVFRTALGDLPTPIQRSPFALPNLAEVSQLLLQAGFTIVKAEEVRKITLVETARNAAERFLLTAPALAQNPELYPTLLPQLETQLSEKLGDRPLTSPLLALVFDAAKA